MIDRESRLRVLDFGLAKPVSGFGRWSPDSKSIVYTRDQDYSDIYELVERR